MKDTIGGMDILLEVANADLYRRNAFRVVELDVDATPNEILIQSERLQMMEKLGISGRANGPLPLNPLPGIDEMREALQRLHDPERRIVDEFFWFWPLRSGKSEKDEAISALSKNDINSATSIWLKLEQSRNYMSISNHNLAILFHALALDIEHIGLNGSLSQNQVMLRDYYWDEAIRRWEIILEHEGGWDYLRNRIRKLEDPRLTTGSARRIRDTLPLFIFLINAKLALRAAENGDIREAKRHLEIMRRWDDEETNLISQQTIEAIQIALKPLNERMKLSSRKASDDSNNDPRNADKILLHFVDQSKKLLEIIDIMLPVDHPTRNASHDQVALAALECQVRYSNETKNWKRSLNLIDGFYPLAASDAAMSRIKENRDIVEGNYAFENIQNAIIAEAERINRTCWFCGRHPIGVNSNVQVKMYGEIVRIPSFFEDKLSWKIQTVNVPRCYKCKDSHEKVPGYINWFRTIALFIGIGGCIGYTQNTGPWYGGPLIMLAVWSVGSAISDSLINRIALARGIKPFAHILEFPFIKQLKSEGWEFGEAPPNTRSA